MEILEKEIVSPLAVEAIPRAKEGITKLVYRSLNIGTHQGLGTLINHIPKNGIKKLAIRYFSVLLVSALLFASIGLFDITDLIFISNSRIVGKTATGILVNFHKVK